MPLRTLQTSKDKPFLTEGQKHAARRVGDLSRIYRHQYPNGLAHNGLGVKYAKYICRTMAFLPDDRRERWLDRYADWMDVVVRDSILSLRPLLVFGALSWKPPRNRQRGSRTASSLDHRSLRHQQGAARSDQPREKQSISRAPTPQ